MGGGEDKRNGSLVGWASVGPKRIIINQYHFLHIGTDGKWNCYSSGCRQRRNDGHLE